MDAKELFNNLTEEQKEKALKCQSPEEFISLANSEGIELTDEQLEGLSGGSDWVCDYSCRQCTPNI